MIRTLLVGLVVGVTLASGAAPARLQARTLEAGWMSLPVHMHVDLLAEDASVGHLFAIGQDTAGLLTVETFAINGSAPMRTASLPGLGWPTAAAVSARAHRLFVAALGNAIGPAVGQVDTVTGASLGIVRTAPPVSSQPSSVSAGPDMVAVDDHLDRVITLNRLRIPSTPGTAMNSIAVLRASTGALLHTYPSSPGDIPNVEAVDDSSDRVFVGDAGSGRVEMRAASTGALLATVRVGGNPCAMAVDRGPHRVVVVDSVSPGRVIILDGRNDRVVRSISLHQGVYPCAVAVDERSRLAFVSEQNGTIATIDINRGVLRAAVAVGEHPVALALDQRRRTLFVANCGVAANSDGVWETVRSGSVSVLNSETGAVEETLSLAGNPNAVLEDSGTRDLFVALMAIPSPAASASFGFAPVLLVRRGV